jgi:hypothetical protein
VAGQHSGVVVQHKDLVPERGEHLLVIATGKVGSADRACKQGVAGDQPTRPVISHRPEGHRAAGVARGVVDGQSQSGQLQGHPVSQQAHLTRLAELNPATEEPARIGGQRP